MPSDGFKAEMAALRARITKEHGILLGDRLGVGFRDTIRPGEVIIEDVILRDACITIFHREGYPCLNDPTTVLIAEIKPEEN